MADERLVNNCENCIVSWKNFKNLSKNEIKLLNENRYEATFKPGEIILKQGSPASNAVFLSSGMGKIYIEGSEDKNFILGIALPSHNNWSRCSYPCPQFLFGICPYNCSYMFYKYGDDKPAYQAEC